MEFGYIRSATNNRENLNEQIKKLNSYGTFNIVEERTGNELEELLSRLQAGDSIVVTSAERLTRNSKKLIKIINYTQEKGIIIYVGTQPLDIPCRAIFERLAKEAGYELR